MFVSLLCIMLLAFPAVSVNAGQPVPTEIDYMQDSDSEQPSVGQVLEESETVPPVQETVVVDLLPLIVVQEEQLKVLKSCNTLLLSLALFELFRLGRGLSRRVFHKGVANG